MEVKIYNTFSATDYGSRGIHAYDLYPHKCMIYFKAGVSDGIEINIYGS